MTAGRDWRCSCDENREDQRGDICMVHGGRSEGNVRRLTEVCGLEKPIW